MCLKKNKTKLGNERKGTLESALTRSHWKSEQHCTYRHVLGLWANDSCTKMLGLLKTELEYPDPSSVHFC